MDIFTVDDYKMDRPTTEKLTTTLCESVDKLNSPKIMSPRRLALVLGIKVPAYIATRKTSEVIWVIKLVHKFT